MTTKRPIAGESASAWFEKEFGPMCFGGYLRSSRMCDEITQSEMAKMLGMSTSTLCDIEKGRHLVSPILAVKIATACGLSPEMAVSLALQDQVNKAELPMKVTVQKAKIKPMRAKKPLPKQKREGLRRAA